jgi:hypothetical protein
MTRHLMWLHDKEVTNAIEPSLSWQTTSRPATQELLKFFLRGGGDGSLPYTEGSANGPYHEPGESNPYHPILFQF